MTTCKSNFSRTPQEKTLLHCVEEKLKKRQRIYELARSESEVRVNDYNPLLLLLWQANMDIQFVAQSSLAPSHYVTGYITKAEKSSMQEAWQEIGESGSIYSRLWKFGMRALRSRECGLYEASDLLLGDHLLEKSESVVYVLVEMPHKRSRRLKNHGELVNLAEKSPDSEDIFMEDIVSCNYPNRPDDLEDLCLHDFVANYDSHSKDSQGRRIYRTVTKSRLVSQKMFDPKKEDQRESYFYSLLLLFVPFRDESSLLQEQETAEEAFKRLLPANVECSAYHARLQAMLKAQENLKAITDARKLSAPEEHSDNESDDEPQLMGEAKAAMQDVQGHERQQ